MTILSKPHNLCSSECVVIVKVELEVCRNNFVWLILKLLAQYFPSVTEGSDKVG
jgi:hypothetical protein